MEVRVLGEAFTKDKVVVGNPGHHGGERRYTLWRSTRSAATQRCFYILTWGPRLLELGDRELFLVPLQQHDFDALVKEGPPSHFEEKGLMTMAKEQGITLEKRVDKKGVPKGPEELLADLWQLHLELNGTLLYHSAPPYSLEILVGLGEDLPAMLQKALQGGWRVDDDLAFLFRAHIPVVEPSELPPVAAMPSAPHAIGITATKAGKSSMAARIGRRVERPTPAGMLGFADTEKRHQGILHGSWRTTWVDEVAQEPREEAGRALSTFMELGEVDIPRGLGFRARGHGPVAFLGNVPPQAAPLESFLTVLRAMTLTQAEPLGSRLALLLFKPDSDPAENMGNLDLEALAKGQALLTAFQMHAAPLLSGALLLDGVQRWLDLPFLEDHLSRLEIAANGVAFPEVTAFLKGYRDGHRHARGMALRIAFVDTCHLHLEAQEVQVQALLSRADEIFARVVALREESLNHLVTIASDEVLRRQTLASLYRSQPREYVKRLIAAFAQWEHTVTGELKGRYPLETLREPYLQTPLHDREGHWTFPRVVRYVERNLNEAHGATSGFAVGLSRGSYGLEFVVDDAGRFREAMEVVRVLLSEVEAPAKGQGPPRDHGGKSGNSGATVSQEGNVARRSPQTKTAATAAGEEGEQRQTAARPEDAGSDSAAAAAAAAASPARRMSWGFPSQVDAIIAVREAIARAPKQADRTFAIEDLPPRVREAAGALVEHWKQQGEAIELTRGRFRLMENAPSSAASPEPKRPPLHPEKPQEGPQRGQGREVPPGDLPGPPEPLIALSERMLKAVVGKMDSNGWFMSLFLPKELEADLLLKERDLIAAGLLERRKEGENVFRFKGGGP